MRRKKKTSGVFYIKKCRGKHNVLKDAEVIYYALLCHAILRDNPCDMTKRCDFKFVFDDVEKHIDSF
jgi:hypothetical protein